MIKNLADLAVVREKMQGKITFRRHNPGTKVTDGNVRKHVLICGGTGCTSSKSVQIKEKMEKCLVEA